MYGIVGTLCPDYPRSPRVGIRELINSTQSRLRDGQIREVWWSLKVSVGHATEEIVCLIIKSTHDGQVHVDIQRQQSNYRESLLNDQVHVIFIGLPRRRLYRRNYLLDGQVHVEIQCQQSSYRENLLDDQVRAIVLVHRCMELLALSVRITPGAQRRASESQSITPNQALEMAKSTKLDGASKSAPVT